MTVTIETPEGFEDLTEISALVLEYLGVVHETLLDDGGPGFDLAEAADDTLGNIAAYLPPRGKIYLVRDDEERVVAMSFLKETEPGTAEIKRLYVRPEGRRLGLGRLLTERAMRDAADMGMAKMVLDSLAGFKVAQALYLSLGFKYIDRYPTSEIPQELDAWAIYMSRPL